MKYHTSDDPEVKEIYEALMTAIGPYSKSHPVAIYTAVKVIEIELKEILNTHGFNVGEPILLEREEDPCKN